MTDFPDTLLAMLHTKVTAAISRGAITDQDEANIRAFCGKFAVPEGFLKPELIRLAQQRKLLDIRQGKLPVVQTNLNLAPGEVCHLEIDATYAKKATGIAKRRETDGRLVATSRKVLFLSEAGGFEIPLRAIMRIQVEDESLYLELSTSKGNGYYTVVDADSAGAILDALAGKAQQRKGSAQTTTRYIPKEVRQTVWLRDNGECTECGSTANLHYDHLIPHSRGGSNDTTNIRLLCADCNLRKGDKIDG